MKTHWINQHKTRSLAGLILVDAVFFGLTNPSKVPAVLLIAGFALIVVNLYALSLGLVALSRWYGISLGAHSKKIVLIITGFTGALIGLQSMGQLSVRDLVILMPFVAIGYFYSSYQKT
jgi:hypothetical protein